MTQPAIDIFPELKDPTIFQVNPNDTLSVRMQENLMLPSLYEHAGRLAILYGSAEHTNDLHSPGGNQYFVIPISSVGLSHPSAEFDKRPATVRITLVENTPDYIDKFVSLDYSSAGTDETYAVTVDTKHTTEFHDNEDSATDQDSLLPIDLHALKNTLLEANFIARHGLLPFGTAEMAKQAATELPHVNNARKSVLRRVQAMQDIINISHTPVVEDDKNALFGYTFKEATKEAMHTLIQQRRILRAWYEAKLRGTSYNKAELDTIINNAGI